MRLLLLTFDFPPLNTPQAIRWFYLTRELSRMGHEVDVLTIEVPQGFGSAPLDIPEKISIYRTFPGPLYSLAMRYSLSTGRDRVTQPSTAQRSAVFKGLTRLYELLNVVLFPDVRCEWIPFAYRAGLDLVRKQRYDVLLTSSEPCTSHLIGYLLKNQLNTPWLADYGDPWIYNVPYQAEPQWKIKFLRKVEKKSFVELT